MAKTKTDSVVDVVDKTPVVPEVNVDEKRIKELEDIMLVMHKLCWLFARTPKCATQAEAYRTLDRIRKVIGEDVAEKREKEWRGVK